MNIAFSGVMIAALLATWSGRLVAQTPRTASDGRAVSFIEYAETGKWKTWSDDRLSIRIPIEWRVAIDATDLNEQILADPTTPFPHLEEWTYRVISDHERRIVVSISLFRGGPEYVQCFCAQQNVHEYLEKDGYKFWALTLPGIDARMFKVASETMRLDIHGRLPKTKSDRIRYIIESARPIEPSRDNAK